MHIKPIISSQPFQAETGNTWTSVVKHHCECAVRFGTDHSELLINIHLMAVKHCVSSAINISGVRLNACNLSHLDFFSLKWELDFPSKNILSFKSLKPKKIILSDIQIKYLSFCYIYFLLTYSPIFSKGALLSKLTKRKALFPFLGKALHLGRHSQFTATPLMVSIWKTNLEMYLIMWKPRGKMQTVDKSAGFPPRNCISRA